MAASVRQVQVGSRQEFDNTIMSYIAQGFVIQQQSEGSATLFKKKEFNVIWAVVGFFLCLLPLLVYCVVYATQSDEMVTVTIAANRGPAAGGELTWSEDRQWWWDGEKWRDTLLDLPPGAVLSEDRATWWDGESWRPVPVTTDAPAGELDASGADRHAPEAPSVGTGGE
jgi:hypothetical protein